VNVKSTILWDVMACSPVEIHRLSEEDIDSISRVEDMLNKLEQMAGR
jgi:hypothetical protein